MLIIQFPTVEMRRRALGYLLSRFPGKSWASGEVMVPAPAVARLATEGIRFMVAGPATHKHLAGIGQNKGDADANLQPAARASRSLCRYEVYLPLQFNDRKPVPESLIWQTVEEIETRFSGVSWNAKIVRSYWQDQGAVFPDNNTLLLLDVPDLAENRAFFMELKERLKNRFQQSEILITSYPVDLI